MWRENVQPKSGSWCGEKIGNVRSVCCCCQCSHQSRCESCSDDLLEQQLTCDDFFCSCLLTICWVGSTNNNPNASKLSWVINYLQWWLAWAEARTGSAPPFTPSAQSSADQVSAHNRSTGGDDESADSKLSFAPATHPLPLQQLQVHNHQLTKCCQSEMSLFIPKTAHKPSHLPRIVI